jgi:hypothetical protein
LNSYWSRRTDLLCLFILLICLLSFFSRQRKEKAMCEVTSSNFLQLYPLIIQQIEQSCFLAIDTEFSSLETFPSTTKTIKQFYEQRSNLVKQITIFQFGLAIFSKTTNQQRYYVTIYNFYLNPTSMKPIDVKYIIQSSSIKFLSEYKFDFNKCFYSGISFLNQTQENILFNETNVRRI